MEAVTVHTIETLAPLQTKKIFLFLFARIRGGRNRTNIISTIKNTPSNIHQISQKVNRDYKTVQHHMKILSKHGLVSKIGVGYGATYFLSENFEKNKPLFDEIASKLKKTENQSS